MNIPEGWPTEEMLKAGLGAGPFWDAYGSDISRIAGQLEKAFQAMLAAAPTPPAQESEPVASIEDVGIHGYEQRKAILLAGAHKVPLGTLLYTRPDNSKLRKATEEMERRLRDAGLEHDADYLRVALEEEPVSWIIPQSDKLRKAAEEALHWLTYMNINSAHNKTQVERARQAENNLRAALEGK